MIRKKIIFVNFVILLVLGYFIFHAVYGQRGILSYFKMSKNLESSIEELENLKSERLSIEHKVNLLKSGSLDLDALDEEARKILGYAKENEVVVPVKEE